MILKLFQWVRHLADDQEDSDPSETLSARIRKPRSRVKGNKQIIEITFKINLPNYHNMIKSSNKKSERNN
jgi:hypothetical protein